MPRSAGFWPGEGCGVVVLMRLEDALAQGRRVVAVIRGWGISSDGQGGITRPEVEGQLLALRRAYRRAGFGIRTRRLLRRPRHRDERRGRDGAPGPRPRPARGRCRGRTVRGSPSPAIGSIKANIGHTKAAAGVAGLIKAALALDAQILPPTDRLRAAPPRADRRIAALSACSRKGRAMAGRSPAPRRRQCHGLRGDQRSHRPRVAREGSPRGR